MIDSLPKIEVHLAGAGVGSYVKINGFVIPGLRAVTIQQDVGEVPTLALELISDDIVVTGDAQLAMEVYNPSPEFIEQITESVVDRINKARAYGRKAV